VGQRTLAADCFQTGSHFGQFQVIVTEEHVRGEYGCGDSPF
jgi:hypothetical protein